MPEPIRRHDEAAVKTRPGLFMFTMIVIYKYLYILGITLLRRRRCIKKWFSLLLMLLKGRFYSIFETAKRSIFHFFQKNYDRARAPFTRINSAYLEVKPQIEAKRQKRQFPAAAYLYVLEAVWRLIVKIFSTIFNYTAPVAAAIFLATVVTREFTKPHVLLVTYKDQVIGYIQNEAEFENAAQDVRSRAAVDGSNAFAISIPEFSLKTIDDIEQERASGELPAGVKYLSRSALADTLIHASGSEVEQAYGFYVSGQFHGAIADKGPLLQQLDMIRLENMSGKQGERIDFVKSLRLVPGLYPATSLISTERVMDIVNSNENMDEVYIVKSGDTPTGIADKTGVPYDVLKSMNPGIEERLFEGEEILTQMARPFLSVKKIYTSQYEQGIPFTTTEIQNATYARGYREVEQAGRNGRELVTAEFTFINGLETDRVVLERQVLFEPEEAKVIVGVNDPQTIISSPSQSSSGGTTAAPSTQTSSGFIWPGAGGYISNYLNGYPGHTGIDIAGLPYGSPVYASASGTVVLVKRGWTGYGQYIVIDHGNGYETWYAHNSALYVNVGDRVAQGQVIAAVGSTGNSTGNHIHFEIRYNKRVMNPVNYIGNRTR